MFLRNLHPQSYILVALYVAHSIRKIADYVLLAITQAKCYRFLKQQVSVCVVT
jgi:hypothetical protein